jgi:hypothetical protein
MAYVGKQPSQQILRAGRRNLLINGAKTIFQRSTSATGVTTDIYSAPDRWKTRVASTAEFTISQSSTSTDEFANSTKWDCTTAASSLPSSAFLIYEQRIEGQDLQHLQYGTSSAKTTTLSFHVRSNKTGVYTVGLYSPDGARQISSSYTINSANTFEKKTITFPGDTGGTLNDDNGEGMRVWFWLGGGTNYSSGTQATSWADYDATEILADNQVNLADSTSNEWYITGVQLEVGDVTDFEHRTFGEELVACQRYFYNSTQESTSINAHTIHILGTFTTTRGFFGLDAPVPMRTAPSISLTGSVVLRTADLTSEGTLTSASMYAALFNNTRFSIDCAFGSSTANEFRGISLGTNGGFLLDAEL